MVHEYTSFPKKNIPNDTDLNIEIFIKSVPEELKDLEIRKQNTHRALLAFAVD